MRAVCILGVGMMRAGKGYCRRLRERAGIRCAGWRGQRQRPVKGAVTHMVKQSEGGLKGLVECTVWGLPLEEQRMQQLKPCDYVVVAAAAAAAAVAVFHLQDTPMRE